MSIEYRILLQCDLKPLEDLYVNSMMVDDPLSKSIGLTYPDVQCFFDGALPTLVDGGLSIGAFDGATGELLGSRMVTPRKLTEPYDIGLRLDDPRQKKLATVLLTGEFVKEGVDLIKETGVDEVAYFCGLMVKRSWRKRGIGMRLVEEAIRVAKENGFRCILAETTNVVARHLYDIVGFKVLKTVQTEDFRINDEIVYSNMGDAGTLSLHYLKI